MFTGQSHVRTAGHVVATFMRQSDVRKSGHVLPIFERQSYVKRAGRVLPMFTRQSDTRKGFIGAKFPEFLCPALAEHTVFVVSVRNGSQLTRVTWDLRLAGHTSATHTFLVLSLQISNTI